jgi:radical SAM protein with 4Fe4S-binding SPASM domain
VTGLREELFARYQHQCRPHSVLIELTHRCPCDCRHCFLVREPGSELTTTEMVALLAGLADEGVFNVGFTGGEPFLRSDLEKILAAARSHQFFVTLLTTAMSIGPAEVSMLRKQQVRMMEVSLLGASAETHDGIMRTPGAFDRTMGAVKRLREAGIAVTLKATVLRPNWRELASMTRLAADLGARFAANVSVAPRIDGDTAPQQLSLDETELSELDPDLIAGGLIPEEDHSGGALLTCQAGRTVAGISPEGEVWPCILFRRSVGNLRERSLREIWREDPDPFLLELRAMTEAEVPECASCQHRGHCRRCPGVAYLEAGRLGEPSPSACALARGLTATDRYESSDGNAEPR